MKAQAQAAAAQAAIANAPPGAQAAWSQATGGDANASRINNGAQSALSLIQNGYDQNNLADEQKLISAIAAGVSLIPGYGIVFAGALELLNQVALGIGDALQAVGLIPKPGCQSTGTFTTASKLAEWQSRGADVTPGTFGALAWPALAHNVAIFRNCQKGGLDNAMLLQALVNVWNSTMTGSAVSVFAPTPQSYGDPFVFNSMSGGPLLNNNRGGTTTPLAGLFHPAADFPGGVFPVGAVGLQINGASAAAGATGTTATSKGAAVGGVAAAGVVGTVVYSYVTGKAIGHILEHGLAALTGLFK